MPLPQYQLLLIDVVTGNVKATFDPASFYDLRYSRFINDVGVMAITFPGNLSTRKLFNLDDMLEVYRTSPTTGNLILEETYLCRIFQRFRVDNDERYVVGGVSLNHLISRRVVNPADDPAQAGGYSTKAGAADTVIRAYMNEQLGPGASVARRIPGLSLLPVGGVGFPVGARLRFENLLTAMQDLAQRGNTDFIVQRGVGVTFVVTIAPIGVNRSQGANYPFAPFIDIDPLRGNMQKPNYKLDRKDEKNFVYEQSQGQGLNRTMQTLAGITTGDSPLNLIEFQNDARNVQQNDSVGLTTAARVAIRDNLPQEEFTFDQTAIQPGNTYRLDWDVGDRVTASWNEISRDLRITMVEVTIADRGEQIKITTARYDT